MIEAGVLGLRISPIATGFWRRTDAQLKAQKASTAQVKVEADIKKASSQMAMFRMREQANAINLRVKVDESSIRTANEKIRYIEHTWKQSDIKRAVRVQVFVAGASALPALTQGLMSVTAAMTELSRVSLGLPGLLAGVGAAAASLFTGLNGVSAAFKASNDGMQKSSQYARQYAQASRELENAQRDVVKALKDANRELEDQKTRLARGQLSVEQAALNVRRANEAVFRGGFQSITEYQQALLDVKSANLDFSEAVKQNSRNINDYYESAGRGAAQSDSFKSSLDNLSNSLDNFRKAQFQAAGMSEQFVSAMENLAPAGQDFVLQVLKMKGAWQGLQNSVQTTLFKGLGDEITNLANRQLPVLKTGMQQVAAAINNDFTALARTLSRDSSIKSIANIFQNTGQALSAATPGLDSFTSGLLNLSEVGTRFLPRVALAFNKVMARFEAFIQRADEDGSLNRWIDSGLKLVASLGRSLLSIGSILNSVTEAYNKATGNVGGFAATMERGLARFAKRLASPEGQGQLIKWMRTSREFMATISEALPGIQDIFAALGEGARAFAERAFPIFAGIGKLIGGSNGVLKTFVTLTLAYRTVLPILSQGRKALNLLNAGMDKYVEKRAALLSTRTAAWKAAFDADGAKFAAQTRLKALNDEVRESDRLYTRMFNSRAAAELDFTRAQNRRKELEGTVKSSKRAANKDGLDEAEAKRRRATYLADAKVYKQAKDIEKRALEEFNIRDERLYNAAANRSQIRRDLEVARPRAYRDLREATNLATKAQENFNKVNRLTADGMSGKWARSVALMKGKYDGLRNAMGFIGGVGASAGLAVGVAVAFDQLTAAQDRNRASADNLKESQDALAQTLSKGTGSATAATLEENARQLRDRSNPVHPDDPGQNFDAAKILEGQLGMSLSEAVNLTLPTEVKKREARLAPADAQIIAAVPGLDEWKQWGKDFEKNGVNSSVYGKALNGDPDSIGKVEAAREAIRYENTPGLKLGAAVAIGSAPNDLGAAQEQLDRSGPYGGLRGLSLATGAARSIGNESLAKSQEARESANVVPQRGLNSRGSSAFGKFTLGPNGAIINPDGSAVVEVETYPGEAWIQSQADKGISVERRFPNGAVITIDPEFGRQYFNGYARGGPVWGAGSATSDSIPAMLSNGEFVINAKSASLIGHDRLQQMNSMKFANGGLVRRYAPGGPVLPLNPPPDDGGSADVVGAILGGNNGPASIDPFNPGGVYGNVPTPTAPSPPIRTDPVNSAPVVRPYVPPPSAISQFGSIANGIDYIPRLGGSGALSDYGTTAASAVDKAPINPDANILDYLVQVSNAFGLKPGSGPADTDAGNKIADELGIMNHGPIPGNGMRPAQHDVNRALDMGTAEQSQAGEITEFVKAWMSDPTKVAATRQLIYRDPTTGQSFGIIKGRQLFGDELQSVYGDDLPDHTKHVHLALEGVPLSAFKPNLPTANIPKLGDMPKAPQSPVAISPGPAASTPKSDVQLSTPGAIKGPFGDIPFDPINFLKQIGAAILNGIFAFFGVDGSGFVNALFGLGGQQGLGIGKQVEEIPQADPDLVAGLDAQIAQYEAVGTPAALAMAEKIKAGRDDYLKQFDSVNAAASAESAAAYFDSIGQPDTAAKLRAGVEALGPNPNEPNPERFGPVTTVPGTGEKGPTALPRSGVFVAPAANYSGGTPETHNAIYRAFKEAGYPDSEWPSLVELLNHENDTYDPLRPTGGPNSDASGIFQFLSTTWDEVGMQYSTDPYIQSVAGMRYIKKRYGTPTAAWNFWQNPNPPGPDPNWPHWYSTGGMVALARGGMVSGPGTGTSDSIPAMLSNGEFVMRADAVKHWGTDKLHAMNGYANGGLVGYAPGGSVSDENNTLSNWWENTKNFGKGFVGAGKELITGIAPLVGLAGDGAPGVADSWKSMATGLAPLVGLGGAGAPGVGEAWKELGKGAIRYDQWTAGGTKAEAAGGNLFDILTAVLPGGALTKGIKSGELGAKTAQVARNAGNAFTSPTAFADSLKLTPERRASLADIPNVDIKGINPLAKRQALTSIADLHINNPEIPISSVSTKGFSEISNLWGKKYAASVTAYADPADRSIVLNKSAMNMPGGLFANIFSGFTNGSFRKSNIYALMAHEFGHLVDFHDNQSVAIGDVATEFIKNFAKDKPEFLTQDGELSFGGLQKAYESKQFANRVRGALSGYSYKNATPMVPRAITNLLPVSDPAPGRYTGIGGAAIGRINLVEAKAEAFSDVAINGDKARPESKIINDLVLSSIAKRKATQQKMARYAGAQPPPTPGTRISSSPPPAMGRAMGSLKPKKQVAGAGILQLPADLLEYYSAAQVDPSKVTSIAKNMEKTGVTSPLNLDVSVYGGILPGAIDPSKVGTTQKMGDGPSILAAARLLGLDNIPTRITERVLPDGFTGPFNPRDYPYGGVNSPRMSKNDTGIPHRSDYNDLVYYARQASASAARRAYIASLPPLPKGSAYRFLELPGDDESYVFSYLGKGGRENPNLKDFDDVVARGKSPFIELGRNGPWPMTKGGPDGVLRVINNQFPRKKPYPLGNYRPGEIAMINAYTQGYSLGPRMMQEAIDNPDSMIQYAANSPVLTEKGAQMNARFGWDPEQIDGGMGFGGLLVDPNSATGDYLQPPFRLRTDLGQNFLFPGYRNGGHVSGPGGPRSDLIPAMLSDGEFVMSAAATERIGAGRLTAMNKFANGGPVPPAPSGGSDPDAFKDLSKIMTTPLFKPAESGSSDPDAFKDLSAITPANIVGSALAPKGGGGGVSASAAAPKPKDPRAILGAAPRSDSYVNPALAGAIKGGFNTVGSIISTAASLAAAGATSGASAAIPGGSAAAASLISAGTQMAGDVAVGAANILSAFLVGTVTPSQTGQGYGAPLLPQQQPGGGVNNFQSIHNGNVVTNNLSEYSRLKDRKDAQKAAPFFNRVNQ
jgi:hypothetical protein